MNVVGAVTAGAAGLAAVLSGVNLYVSGRREMDRWTRETLVEIFAAFLDASFIHGAACRALVRDSPPDPERQRLRADVVTAHDLDAHSLTRLRLLATSCVVTAARALIEAERALIAGCFADTLPSTEDPEDLLEPVRLARERLIESARSVLRLRDPTGSDHYGRSASWRELRALAQDAEKQDKG
jgi:hypothetical protein